MVICGTFEHCKWGIFDNVNYAIYDDSDTLDSPEDVLMILLM